MNERFADLKLHDVDLAQAELPVPDERLLREFTRRLLRRGESNNFLIITNSVADAIRQRDPEYKAAHGAYALHQAGLFLMKCVCNDLFGSGAY